MKLILVSIISWLTGVAVISASSYLFYGELSGADFMGFAGMSLMASALIFPVLYIPGLYWLRRRLGGCRPALAFPLASALLLNAPLFLAVALMAGGRMAASEATLFAAGFAAMGIVFGMGFVWSRPERAA